MNSGGGMTNIGVKKYFINIANTDRGEKSSRGRI